MKLRERYENPLWLRPELRVLCALLCMLIVALMLTSCRGQRAHIENVEATDEAPEPEPSDPIILDAEWIRNKEPEHAFANQLLLDVSTGLDPQTRQYLATLRIVFPDSEEVLWTNMPVGTRKILDFEDAEYLVDVTEVAPWGARISIARKL